MHKYIGKFKILYYYLALHWYYKLVFAKMGAKTRVQKLLRLECPENIYIGDSVNICRNTWLAANPLTGESECKLEIGSGTYIGHFAHIYCTRQITIADSVLIADKVYISDNSHQYTDINLPILKQAISQIQTVTIGTGAWLGEGVVIIGANVGKNSIIGANSVVTKNIPDYCIAVGAPAKIIKKYCFERQSWRKVHANGSFIDDEFSLSIKRSD